MKKKRIIIKQRLTNLKCVKRTKIMLGKTLFCLQRMSKNGEQRDKDNFSTKDSKTGQKETKKLNKFVLLLCGSLIGFLNGFFGGGGGMICVPLLQKSLSLDAKTSHATAIAVIFPLSLISASIYVINGFVDSLPLLTVGIGVVLGGVIGAFALKFLPPKAVRIIFALIMLAGGIKMII